MTVSEAQAIHAEHQQRRQRATPAEFMAYMQAKQVLAAAARLALSPGQRGYLAAAKLPSTTTTEEIAQ